LSLLSDKLRCCRYSGDVELLDGLRADPDLARRLDDTDVLRRRSAARAQLLAQAVRADLHMIPRVARSMADLVERAGVDSPMEAYVFQDPAINAFVTRGRVRVLVGLSSAAVNGLSETELAFVIGHELGHTVFGHVDVGVARLLQGGTMSPRACMQMLAWQRAAEISADRAGLVCCGSLEVAATALYKTLSGLSLEGMSVDPKAFARQWEHLEREVIEGGDSDQWQLSHPFPPLRMKAMNVFEATGGLEETLGGETGKGCAEADAQVRRLLALMDPLARESRDAPDPVLADFFLWGGLYVALANGELHAAELEHLASITSRRALEEATLGGAPDADACLTGFDACIAKRRKKLKALEIHRILHGLLQVADADGGIDERETHAFQTLATKLGIAPAACQLILTQFQQGR